MAGHRRTPNRKFCKALAHDADFWANTEVEVLRVCSTQQEADRMEAHYIRAYRPFFNRLSTAPGHSAQFWFLKRGGYI